MIEMGHRQLPSLGGRKFVQNLQQHDRIHAPGNRHQQALAPLAFATVPQGVFHRLNQINHPTSVACRWKPEQRFCAVEFNGLTPRLIPVVDTQANPN